MDALTFLHVHVPLFAGVAEEALEPLAVAASLKQYNAGQTILFQGMTVDGLHVVASGAATVHAKRPGKSPVQVAELRLGEAFGETSIIEHGIAGATVKAGAAGATVLVIPQEAFRGLLQRDESFALRVNDLIRARRPADAPAAR